MLFTTKDATVVASIQQSNVTHAYYKISQEKTGHSTLGPSMHLKLITWSPD